MEKKRICLVCGNEDNKENAIFCSVCGDNLKQEKKYKYEVIIKNKETGEEVESIDCNGMAIISKKICNRKEGKTCSIGISVGMVNIKPSEMLMATKAIQDEILGGIDLDDEDIGKDFDEFLKDMLEGIRKKYSK